MMTIQWPSEHHPSPDDAAGPGLPPRALRLGRGDHEEARGGGRGAVGLGLQLGTRHLLQRRGAIAAGRSWLGVISQPQNLKGVGVSHDLDPVVRGLGGALGRLTASVDTALQKQEAAGRHMSACGVQPMAGHRSRAFSKLRVHVLYAVNGTGRELTPNDSLLHLLHPLLHVLSGDGDKVPPVGGLGGSHRPWGPGGAVGGGSGGWSCRLEDSCQGCVAWEAEAEEDW